MTNTNRKEVKTVNIETSKKVEGQNTTNSIFESETVISPIFDRTTASVPVRTAATNEKKVTKLQESLEGETTEGETTENYENIFLSKIQRNSLTSIKKYIILFYENHFNFTKIDRRTLTVAITCLVLIVASLFVFLNLKEQKLSNLTPKPKTEEQMMAPPRQQVRQNARPNDDAELEHDDSVEHYKKNANIDKAEMLNFNTQQDFLSAFEMKSIEARFLAIGK